MKQFLIIHSELCCTRKSLPEAMVRAESRLLKLALSGEQIPIYMGSHDQIRELNKPLFPGQ